MRLLRFHKRLTCLTLMALAIGVAATAETKTEGFDNFNATYESGSWTQKILTLPEGWDYSGPMLSFEKSTESGTYKKAKPSICVYSSNADSYLITPMLQGEFSFWLRNYTKTKPASIKAYTCILENGELNLGSEIGSQTLSSNNTTFYEITFNNPTATRVALLISQAYFDDFTYTPAVPTEGPSLVIADYANGSSFDFGTVSKGTEQRFTLTNKGTETLNIESITISGGFDLSANETPLSIESGKQEYIVIATPDEDASGVLTIISNDPESPYEINVSSKYKVPKPIMGVAPLQIDLGRVTADASGTFIVSNTGDATLTATLTSDNTAFEVSKPNLSVEPGQSEEVTVMYKYEATAYGVNSANITVTPNEGEPAVVAVSAKVPNPNVWSEDFSGNTLPEGWEIQNNTNCWKFSNGYAEGSYSSNRGYLTTPSLAVESVEDEMTFQYKTTYNGTVYIKIQYSKDGGEYKDYKTITEKSKVNDFKDYTITGLDAGNYCFRFENDDYILDNFEGFKLNLNAPKMEVTPLGDVNFGKVTAQPESKTFTVANVGTGKLTVNISCSNTDFSVEPAELTDIENENPATFTVNFNYDAENLGEKSAVITITPTYNKDASVSFSVYANAKDPNIWEEDFEDGVIPEGWSNSGWKVEKSNSMTGNGTYMAYAGTDNNSTLTTPRLYASEGQKLAFELGYTDSYDPLTVEYSHDKNEWIHVEDSPMTSGGVKEFTAPEDGFYYLRFQGRYGRVDNFNGFKLSPKDHDLSITGKNIPTAGNQYVEYTATVTLQEMMGMNETVTATLYFGTEQMATVTETLEPNATVTLPLSFLPTEGVDNAEAFIKVSYAENESLETDAVAVTIETAPVWDENAQADLTEGTLPVVVFNYVPVQGWNSIGVPFALDDDYLTLIFGPSYIVYELNGYENNTIFFREAAKYGGKYAAGYPYIVYVNSASPEDPVISYSDDQSSLTILRDVKIEKTEPQSETKNGVTFSANFSPREAGMDETLYEIDATDHSLKEISTVKGYRGSITLDAGITSVPRVVFYDNSGGETGITAIEEDSTLREIIFNLNGQKVKEPLVPGIYIINGKKTVVR